MQPLAESMEPSHRSLIELDLCINVGYQLQSSVHKVASPVVSYHELRLQVV